MSDKLSVFKYHPNPIQTGNAKKEKFLCVCCEKEKMYSYEGNMYTALDLENKKVCLDCIHDGSAAKKFNAEFTDFPHNFRKL